MVPSIAIRSVFACGLIAGGFAVVRADALAKTSDPSGRARAAYARGEHATAIERFVNPQIEQARSRGDVRAEVDGLLLAAEGYRTLGMMQVASETLERAIRAIAENPTAVGSEAPSRLALAYDRLGVARLGTGAFVAAEQALTEGLDRAQAAGRLDLAAMLLQDLGNVFAASGELPRALAAFDDAARLADRAEAPEISAGARVGLVQALIDFGWSEGLTDRLLDAHRAVEALPDTIAKVGPLLAIGRASRRARERFSLTGTWRRRAHDAYRAALDLIERVGNPRLESYALGYLGELYEDEGRFEEALGYTRRAAFLAQRLGTPEVLYLWEWQTARLLRAQGVPDAAIDVYRRTLETLETIRGDLAAGPRGTYRQIVEPVFLEFADLVLKRSPGRTDPQDDLREVRSRLERLKSAEIEEYFELDCPPIEADLAELDRLSTTVAVVYPVLLPDRTELLVRLPDGLKQFTTPVGAAELTEQIDVFRRHLQAFTDMRETLPIARRLYEWLFAPFEGELSTRGIDTVIVVPDGPLRTIPLAALHDGERFLVERYAFATTPGLLLTDPRPLPRESVHVLVNGLTEAVQGFPPLPHVEEELRAIGRLFATQVLEDEEFRVASLERLLAEGDHAIVHIATHGEFSSDHAQSFLLTYDAKLSLDGLRDALLRRRYGEHPVELLTLSACETAAGDDRAALGLAGVALQAGARSALASLWSVNDASTAELISAFYQGLEEGQGSKARALQRAQIALMHDERYRNPGYWAPFLLIGNWL